MVTSSLWHSRACNNFRLTFRASPWTNWRASWIIDPASIVKLASNENPLGASPKALAAIREALAELTRYPDGNGFALKTLLADQCRVELNQVTLGNGSNDILELVARAYLAPGLNAVFSEHAFAVYPIVTQAVGATGQSDPGQRLGS